MFELTLTNSKAFYDFVVGREYEIKFDAILAHAEEREDRDLAIIDREVNEGMRWKERAETAEALIAKLHIARSKDAAALATRAALTPAAPKGEPK